MCADLISALNRYLLVLAQVIESCRVHVASGPQSWTTATVPIAGHNHRDATQCLSCQIVLPGPETLHTRVTAPQDIRDQDWLAIAYVKTSANSHANLAHAALGPNNNRQSITTVRACAHCILFNSHPMKRIFEIRLIRYGYDTDTGQPGYGDTIRYDTGFFRTRIFVSIPVPEFLSKVDAYKKSVLVLALSHVFLATLKSFASLHLLDVSAHLRSLNVFCLLASLRAIASADVLNIFVGLNALDGLARLDPLNVLAGHSPHSLPAFAGLQSLDPLRASLARLSPLDALADLGSLQTCPGLHTLDTFCGHTAELPLQVRVVEWHIGAMSRVEIPVLELPTASDVDSVELAVKDSVGLDRAVTSISPIVAVP
jgi:hypothetical protein